MSTDDKALDQKNEPVLPQLSMRDLAVVLVKHYGLTEGKYDLMVEFQIGTGPMGPDKDSLVPGAMIGLSRVGLLPVAKLSPNTIDASQVNPKKKTIRKPKN